MENLFDVLTDIYKKYNDAQENAENKDLYTTNGLSYIVYETQYIIKTGDYKSDVEERYRQAYVDIVDSLGISRTNTSLINHIVDEIEKEEIVNEDGVVNVDRLSRILSNNNESLPQNSQNLQSLLNATRERITCNELLAKETARVVGIYNNNGLEVENGFGQPENLIGMAYINNSEIDTQADINDEALSMIASGLSDPALEYVDLTNLLKRSAKFINITDKLLSGVAGSLTGAALDQIVSEFDESRRVLNEDIKALASAANLSGLTPSDEKKIATANIALSAIAAFIPGGAIASMVIGGSVSALTSMYANRVSNQNGREEINRYISRGGEAINIFPKQPNKKIDTGIIANIDNIVGNSSDRNLLRGNGNKNLLQAVDGNHNVLKGNSGDDQLIGSNNIDTLEGGLDNDILQGNEGNDILKGGSGNDTYIYSIGDGTDTIIEESFRSTPKYQYGDDTLILKNLKQEDVDVYKENDDLIIQYKSDLKDKIVIKKHFLTDSQKRYSTIDNVKFSNKDLMSISDFFRSDTDESHSITITSEKDTFIYGNGGGDKLYGQGGDDTIYGDDYYNTLAGIDELYGGAGEDTLIGGKGKDTLYGGIDSDTYIFRKGDGKDTIIEESGSGDTITFTDIYSKDIVISERAGASNNDLVLFDYNDPANSVTITDFYNNSGEIIGGIEYINFIDLKNKSLIDFVKEKSSSHITTYSGTAENDYYKINKENTNHVIITNERGGTVDKIDLDYSYKDVRVESSGTDLIFYLDTDGKYLKVEDFFDERYGYGLPSGESIEYIKFADTKNINLANLYVYGLVGNGSTRKIDDNFINPSNYNDDLDYTDDTSINSEKNNQSNDVDSTTNNNTDQTDDDYHFSNSCGMHDIIVMSEKFRHAETINGYVGKGGNGPEVYLFTDVMNALGLEKKWTWEAENEVGVSRINILGLNNKNYFIYPKMGRVIEQGGNQFLFDSNIKNVFLSKHHGEDKTFISKAIVKKLFGFHSTCKYNRIYLFDNTKNQSRYENLYKIKPSEINIYFNNSLDKGFEVPLSEAYTSDNNSSSGFDTEYETKYWAIRDSVPKEANYDGTKYKNELKGSNSNDHLDGRGGNDVLIGKGGNDYIEGGKGNDILYGNSGNDLLRGDEGNNIFAGGSGNDIYIIDDKSAENIIDDYANDYNKSVDIVAFNFRPDNIKLKILSNGDLKITFDKSSYCTIIKNYMKGIAYRPEKYFFEVNEVTWNSKKLADEVIKQNSDYFTQNKEKIYFGRGSGYQVLSPRIYDLEFTSSTPRSIYLSDTNFGDCIFTKSADEKDLVIQIKGTNDILVIKDQLVGNRFSPQIDFLEFKDDSFNAIKIQYVFNDVPHISLDNKNNRYFNSEFDEVYGLCGDDIIYGSDKKNINKLYGGTGDDLLYSRESIGDLYGGSGNDKLFGNNENDTLNGGEGNDNMYGGAGDDTYVFSKGFGNDIVTTMNGKTHMDGEHFVFTDIKSTEVYFEVDSSSKDHLCVKVTGTNDSIRVLDYFRNSGSYIDSMKFSDDVKWDREAIDIAIGKSDLVINGTSGNDTLTGYDVAVYSESILGHEGDDTIRGLLGNDHLYGDEGDDRLYGGSGNDRLYGGSGNDKLYGEAGNDYIVGGSGDDMLRGCEGSNTLYGGLGYDTYIISGDSNHNIIRDGYFEDGLIIFENLNSNEAILSKDSNDLIVWDNKNEIAVIKDYYKSTTNQLQIQFSDNVRYSYDMLSNKKVNVIENAKDNSFIIPSKPTTISLEEIVGKDIFRNIDQSTINWKLKDDENINFNYWRFGGRNVRKRNSVNIKADKIGNSFIEVEYCLKDSTYHKVKKNIYIRDKFPDEIKEIVNENKNDNIQTDNINITIRGCNGDLYKRNQNIPKFSLREVFGAASGSSRIFYGEKTTAIHALLYTLEKYYDSDGTSNIKDSRWDWDWVLSNVAISDSGIIYCIGDDRNSSVNGWSCKVNDQQPNILPTNQLESYSSITWDYNYIGGILFNIASDPNVDIIEGQNVYRINDDFNKSIQLFDNNNINTVHFKTLSSNKVTIERVDNNLLFIDDTNNKLMFENYYNNNLRKIDQVVFSDGSIVHTNEIDNLNLTDKGAGKDIYTINNSFNPSENILYVDNTDVINLHYENTDSSLGTQDQKTLEEHIKLDFKVAQENMNLKITYNTGKEFLVNDYFKNNNSKFASLNVDQYTISNDKIELLIQHMNEYCSSNGLEWSKEIVSHNQEMQDIIFSSFTPLA